MDYCFFASLLTAIYVFIYRNSNEYSSMVVILISIVILITTLLLFTTYAVFNTYRNGSAGTAYIWLIKIGTNFLLPTLISLPGLFKGNKDTLRFIYINISNTLVQSKNIRYLPEKILLLLPHCLQNSECEHKITQNIDNCQKCGSCCIGSVVETAKAAGVHAVVVNGGTAARNIVKTHDPGVIIAVACERELTSGIIDIANIPVIGIINKRPNGQCNNTTVDFNVLQQTIEKVVDLEPI